MTVVRNLVTVLLISAIVGGVLFLCDTILNFYLPIIFPIAAGSAIGVATYAASLNKRLSTLVLLLLALIGVAVTSATYWGGSYAWYRNQLITEIMAVDDLVQREKAAQLLDEFHQDAYGTTGFTGFFADLAEAGFSITRLSSSDAGIEIRGDVFYVYAALEVVLMLAFAVMAVVRREHSTLTQRYRQAAAR